MTKIANPADLTSDLVEPNAGLQQPLDDNWLGAIVSSSPDAIIGQTRDGVVTSFNPAAEKLFGYRAEEIVGKPIRILIPADRQEEEDCILARTAAGESERYETIRLHKDGSPIDVSISVSPIRDGRGRIIGAARITRDVSERVQAEAALRDSQERLAAALRAGNLGVHDYDPRTGLIKWDREVYRLWGVPEDEEVTYETFETGVHPKDLDAVKTAVASALDPAGTHRLECEYRVINRADGMVRWVFSDGDVTFENGRPVRLVGIVQDITARKQAEEQLRQLATFNKAALKSLGEGLYTIDTQGLVTFINPAAEELFGWSFAELRGKKMHDMTHHHYRDGRPFPSCECAGFQVLTHGKPLKDYEDVFIRKDGTFFDVIYTITPLRDDGGQITGLIVVFSDITDRKRAEEALRESEEQFRTLADAIPQMAWMTNGEGWVYWYNRRWYEYTGTTPEQMEGWGWQSVHDSERLPAVLEQWKVCIATGEPFDMVFPLRGADGVFRPFLTRIQPLKNAEGRVLRWFGTNTDVEELKRTEEALRESEERERAKRLEMETILTAIPAAVLVAEDRACARISANRSAREILRLPDGANASKSAPESEAPANFEVFSTDGKKLRAEELPIQQAAETGRAIPSAEFELRFKEGDLKYLLGNALPLFGAAGEIKGAVGAFLDITERKRAEEHIRWLLGELNHRAKNLLCVVQAIASQTAASEREDFFTKFSERIRALAANQDLLVKSQWQGVDLEDLVSAQLAHFEGLIGGRIEIAGPPLRIAAEAAQSIAMALHELATNAAKYGALSNGDGRVIIAWDIGPDKTFHLSWTESGGAAVASPTRQGYGTTVITRGPEHQLGAKATLEFLASGVTWRLSGSTENVLERQQETRDQDEALKAGRGRESCRRGSTA